ncbi:4Fe-4S dicluster domain-containing protein [Desulfohalobium retbaense]|uniref:Iron-sulfur binding protein n=1 Tax=Desulfohalobium retbaense (strain ATCC 49708 / DSM 5692 / JCM 16813 / HR100) TaxID=485915 RepID=C8WZM0_DESRD|nr:4Fe-4S dicluster domain-containing protein [Desulfohalobium retbaense]ACV67495.1 iron-sulfur binding protein [Desulfohalobium retbaense DSM 5692]ACV69596.1 iron-sulfur binding protein [Desulfohalobium retbaense DSM 5692]
MGATKFIAAQDLPRWLTELQQTRQVYVPVQDKQSVVFAPFSEQAELVLDRQPTTPPKEVVFPQTEELVHYKYTKREDDPGRNDIEIESRPEAPAAVVVGCRPCGARGFATYDRVYTSDAVCDPFYKSRREQTAFVSIACKRPENSCFCHWTGGGPADTTGSDVLLTEVEGGYVAEACTDTGEALLSSTLFGEAGGKEAAAKTQHEEALAAMGTAPDLSDVPAKLLKLFEDMDFWEAMSAKCIACGACTYLCPTCYCFNITDEGSGYEGRRVRTWDTCMSFLFTLEASMHNPRPTKAHRLRNRVGHKFCYYPDLHEGAIACCGCGRCIKHCPVAVDIREIVLRAKEEANG